MKVIIDIEANNLLQPSLDYSVMPFRLKPDFKLWCVVVMDVDTGHKTTLRLDQCTRENIDNALLGATEIIGHNIVAYDLPVLRLLGLMDYSIAYPDAGSCKVNGRDVVVTDTLVWSKLLDPDRFGGHSLEAWGNRLGDYKLDFHDFSQYSEEMVTYCEQDVAVNRKMYLALQSEAEDHDWSRAYNMELKLCDLTLNQELFGFELDVKLADKCLKELNEIMQDKHDRLNKLIPPKKLNKGDEKKYTPPKIQFKKNGEPSAHMLKFAEKVGGELECGDDGNYLVIEGRRLKLPYTGPVIESLPSTIDDLDTLKSHLLDLGWEPIEWKERDLTKNADKTKRDFNQMVAAIERYVKETLTSEYKDYRCKILDVDPEILESYLIDQIADNRPIRVPTSPSLRVGVEKELCPKLEKMGEQTAFVKEVVEYLTYKHRRNSIAGGMDEDGVPSSGFVTNVRVDGRIPTPADTLGANTGRYRHKIVCNIPRISSLYGENMRNLFKPGKGLYQLGFDFASLEARVQGHYCLPYTDGEALAESLVAEKPNDIHSVNARKLGIDRDSAKSFSYATLYGAQPKKLAKMLGVSVNKAKQLYEAYWEAVPALKELRDRLEDFWAENGKQWIPGLDGRRLKTRSKHSLINVLFQSGGAIATKWSVVRTAQLLEHKGVLGDVFKHNVSEPKVWQMVVMHDEVQYAVHPKLMDVRVYASDEEAEAVEGNLLSAVGHGPKGPYRGFPTLPVLAIDRGIKKAVGELDLKVPLGFEWIPGGSWGMCH